MFKVLQISTGYSDGKIEKEIIEKAGGIHVLTDKTEPEQIVQAASDAQGLLVTLTQIPAEVINGMTNLKLIVRAGIGVDNICLEQAKENNVKVCNLPNYCQDEVADHTVALLLAIERKIVPQVNDVKNLKWQQAAKYAPVLGLKNKTVGFIGFGGIAQKVALRLMPFGLKILAYDPYLSQDVKNNFNAQFTELEEVLKEADYLTLHLPATPQTTHIMQNKTFDLMKDSAYLINTSRGQLVKNEDLLQALNSGKLNGAALDVIEGDSKNMHIFADCDKVILTPHSAYYSTQSSTNMKIDSAEVFADFIKGNELKNVVV